MRRPGAHAVSRRNITSEKEKVVGERKLMRVQMECKDGRWIAVFTSGRGQRRAELREGLRAGFFGQRERYTRELK